MHGFCLLLHNTAARFDSTPYNTVMIYGLPLNNTAGSHDSLLLYATDSVLKIANISANLKQN
jgi:hypothetical protein